MTKPTNSDILDELRQIRKIIDREEKSKIADVDDYLFSALLMVVNIRNTLSEPDFSPEQIVEYCRRLQSFLTDARLLIEGREPLNA